MVTIKPRVNMVLDPEDYKELEALAKREGKSLSDLARSYVLEMMEIIEDVSLAALASERRKSFTPDRALTHKQVWGEHELRRKVSSRRSQKRSR